MPVAAAAGRRRAGRRQQRPGRRGLRDPARPAGRRVRASRSSPRTSPSTTASPRRTRWTDDERPAAARTGPHGGRLRGAGRLRPAPALPARPGPREALEASECGAFLLFDFYNIRYTTQTWIGGALGDKMTRYALLTRDAPEPVAVGLRLGGQAPPAVLQLAARRELPRRACSACAARSRRRSGLMESRRTRDHAACSTDAGVADAAGRRRHRGAAVPVRDGAAGPARSSTPSS